MSSGAGGPENADCGNSRGPADYPPGDGYYAQVVETVHNTKVGDCRFTAISILIFLMSTKRFHLAGYWMQDVPTEDCASNGSSEFELVIQCTTVQGIFCER